MKKKITIAMCSILMLTASAANAQLFEEGSKHLHIGIGVGSPYAYSSSDATIPPVHASFEIGVTDKIGVGGLIGYTASKWEQSWFGLTTGATTYEWKFSYLVIGARGAYHFLDKDNVDLYAGLMLGYNVASAKFESNDPTLESFVVEPEVGGVVFAGFGGVRYNFSENIGVFAELGYNIALFSVGLHVKL